ARDRGGTGRRSGNVGAGTARGRASRGERRAGPGRGRRRGSRVRRHCPPRRAPRSRRRRRLRTHEFCGEGHRRRPRHHRRGQPRRTVAARQNPGRGGGGGRAGGGTHDRRRRPYQPHPGPGALSGDRGSLPDPRHRTRPAGRDERGGAVAGKVRRADRCRLRTTGAEVNYEVVIRGERVLTTAGFQPREVAIEAGKIVAMEPLGNGLEAETVIDLAPDEVLLPGLVDTHVHINEPGRTEWEGFDSATRAAAKGGVTTVIDMPLNSIPPTINVAALEEKVAATEGKRHVNVGFWGGAVPGCNYDLLSLHDAGVFGFKRFLLHSGVDEFHPLDPDGLEDYLRQLANYDATMIVHAEDSRSIDRAPHCEGDQYDRFLNSRPRSAENLAIAEVIARARWTGGRVHILHLSSSDALPMIASAKRDGVKITAETCPHYLSLSAEEIPAGNTAFKCCPPIREATNRDLLWQGLLDGTIDCIVTDHSPSTIDLKNLDSGDFGTAWGGIASLQVS